MKSILIAYKTKHSTTKEYATLIHNEVESTLENVDDLSPLDLENFEIITFGSWIFDDKIVVSKFIIQNWELLKNKTILLFCDGLTDPNDEKMSIIFNDSFPDYIRNSIYFYPLGGELLFSKLSFFDKLILRFKGKYRETHKKDINNLRPIIIKLYDLRVIG